MTAPTPAPAAPTGRRSLFSLVSDLPRILSDLVRAEIDSFQAEMVGKAKSAGVGAGLVVAAIGVLTFSLGAFVAAAIAGIATALPLWASALIVGGALLLLAVLLILIGVAAFKRAFPPGPDKTKASIEEDLRVIKGTSKEYS